MAGQVVPSMGVRAVVICIGEVPRTFIRSRAAARCREAQPQILEAELAKLERDLEALATAALEPMQSMGDACNRKRHRSAKKAKAALRRGNLRLETGLEPGILSQLRG